jgi:hypothetical protein
MQWTAGERVRSSLSVSGPPPLMRSVRRNSVMKKAFTLIGSGCWLLFAVGFGVLLVHYVIRGAGLQFSGWLFSDFSLFIGMVHICGLVFATVACIAVSAGLWVRAFAPGQERPREFERGE